VSLGIAIALLVVLAGAIVAACYSVPTPDCGFLCGPNGACPDEYTCADDHRCHRVGAPADLVCSTPDAAIDAMVDAMPDAPVDAMVDAMPDAPIDAMVDAPIDAMPDAMIDAMIDAMLDAPETP
jgi:NAD(P)-dependent dehydrogenase (short-subunit alcohol dehydrogenase family)